MKRILFFITALLAIQGLWAQERPSDSITWSVDIEDVVVTAQYAPTDSRSALQDIYTINRETIERRGATNLEQLLQQEANVRINQDLVLGSRITLLGTSGQNVKIMVDGVPVIGRQGGDIDISQINLNNIERVEIVEGPLSVSYGTNALVGVINLVTKKSQLNTWEGRLTTQLEARGENRYALDIGTRIADRLTLRASGGYDVFDGFSEDTLRSVIWNPKEQWFGDLYAGYRFGDDQRVYYTYSHFDEEVTNLGNVRRPTFKPYAFDDYYLTQRINHALSHEGSVGEHFYWQTTAGYNRFERNKRTLRNNFEEATLEEVDGQQDTSTFSAWMLRSAFASRFADFPVNFQVGMDLRYDEATGKRIQDTLSGRENFASIEDYALFGSVRYQPLDILTLEGGLRYAYNTRYNTPLVPSVQARLGITPDWTLRASYGQGFRSPDLKELFFEFIDINHFIIGNPSLLAERSENWQSSLSFNQRTNQGSINFKLKAFYNDFQDKIEIYEYVEDEEGVITPAVDTSTLRYAYFNQDEYRTQGASLVFGYTNGELSLNSNVSVIGFYNPLSAEFTTLDEFTYVLELSNNITYTVPKAKLELALFLRTVDRLISFYPEITDDGETIAAQRIQDGFTMADFTITKFIWKDHIQLTVGARNLLDIQQVDVSGSGGGGAHSGGTGSAPVGPGRNFFVRASIGF